MSDPIIRWSRRGLVGSGLVGAAGLLLPRLPNAQAPVAIVREGGRPQAPSGVQAGDVGASRAVVWSRSDRPARMMVRWSTTESFEVSEAAPAVHALAATDYTAKLELAGLPAGQRIFYEVTFLDLDGMEAASEPVVGSFTTAPPGRRDIRFVWSGDTVGQGWGINPEFGGLKIYRAMQAVEPAFFIHSGDTIYADGPLVAEVTNKDGTPFKGPDGKGWRNIVTEAKSKVAETLADFHGNYAYNLMDENLRAFNAAVPMFAQWDDHEVTNNWYWQKRMDADGRYQEKSVARMAAAAMQAFRDYMPVRRHPLDPERLFTSFRYGPSLEIFRIDLRSYRGPNGDGMEQELSPEVRILGEKQVRWLKQALLASDATWKVIACDMPIGLIVYNDAPNKKGVEAIAQGDPGAPLGRELEVAELLRFIRDNRIRNTVWLTADVHYTAAHRYSPDRARFQDFAPFWEFVSGPLHAGTFGPGELDPTFGPELVFAKAPEPGQANLPPSAGLQFFGQVDIAGETEVMTVTLKDLEGKALFTQELQPEA